MQMQEAHPGAISPGRSHVMPRLRVAGIANGTSVASPSSLAPRPAELGGQRNSRPPEHAVSPSGSALETARWDQNLHIHMPPIGTRARVPRQGEAPVGPARAALLPSLPGTAREATSPGGRAVAVPVGKDTVPVSLPVPRLSGSGRFSAWPTLAPPPRARGRRPGVYLRVDRPAPRSS